MILTKLHQIDEAFAWIGFNVLGAHLPEYRVDKCDDAEETKHDGPDDRQYIRNRHEL